MAMDIAHPLNEEQQILLTQFRTKVASRVSNHGLTSADVQSFVDDIRHHPEVSVLLMNQMRAELARLSPGQRFSFEFD
ncbi:hypothetical protein [Parasynechococcus sp.]|uniref:hypothetical protein n=1 Tax=Parasynechococcus sp. TaxID=3101203 RepID=UPI003703ED57